MAANPVRIPISAEDQFSRVFGKASKGLSSIGTAAAQTAIKVAKIGVAFATAGTAAAAALTKMSMESIDNLAKTADKIGATTEALSGLRHAAELTGVSSNTLDMAMQRLTRRVSEAAEGTGEAKGALIELGINAAALEKLPLDVQMNVIADAMQGVGSQADRVRIAMKLFDSEGVSLVNTLAGGSESLKAMAAEAEHLGITISRVDAAQIEQANDAVTRAQGVFTGLGNQLATAFSPLIQEVADSFRQAALDSEDFGSIGQRVVNNLVGAYGKLLDGLFFMRLGFRQLSVKLLEVTKIILEKLDPAFQFIIDKYNKVAKVLGMDLIDVGKISKMIDNMDGAIALGLKDVEEMLNQPLPSVGIQATFDEIVASSRRMAEEIAKNAPGKAITEGMTDDADAAVKKLSWLEKASIDGAKKRKEFEMKSATEQTSHVLGELGNQFAGVASNNKKLFQLNKAFQIAQAIMQTYQGATLALSSYPPPLSFVMAGAQVASGLAQVAQIKAQSFEGGGFTGFGARAGGNDTKGGFLATLHPGEEIIDHRKGGGSGITIINNVDARGAGPEVDMKIQQAMQVTSQQTIATVQDLMRRRRFA